MGKKVTSVDAYIVNCPGEVQEILRKIRQIIRQTAPDAEESISYGMPAYKTCGKPLVYFAAFPKHIGFYALPTGHEKFKVRLAKYKQGKGSVQFPLEKEIPYELIAEIARFRVQENHERAQKKLK